MTLPAYEKVMGARCALVVHAPFYGSFAMNMKFVESHETKTMTVTVETDGAVRCYFNPDFVHFICPDVNVQANVLFLAAIIQHEVEHVLRLHCTRIPTHADETTWNIACDMVVNGPLSGKHLRIKNLPDQLIWLPERWDVNASVEEIYKKLVEKEKQTGQAAASSCPMCGKEDGDCPACNSPSRGGDQNGIATPDQVTWNVGTRCDDHSTMGTAPMPEQQQRQLVKELIKQAAEGAPGNLPGHYAQLLKELEKSVVNWKAALRRFVGRYAGSRRTTYARRNRRIDRFGMKGVSHHASCPLTIAVDTSGSITDLVIQHFFAEVEAISYHFEITLVQFYHEIQAVTKYKRGMWKKIQVMGRGGTSFVNLFDEMEKRKIVGKGNIVLTDGYAGWPDKRKYPVMWFMTTDVVAPWGKTTPLPDFALHGDTAA
jgi:predicted metal-dependent peptidase